MKHVICALALGLGLVVAGTAAAQDISKLNDSIAVPAGQTMHDIHTVNGNIHVGAKASIHEGKTVNGDITLDKQAQAESLKAVNGDITLASGVRVSEDVEAVNGNITLHKGAEVRGEVSNVTGAIKLDAARVGDGLETIAGDITVGARSHVSGGIEVDNPNDEGTTYHSNHPHTPRIVIGPHAVVDGPLVFRRDVKLYVSDSATIGPVSGATVHTFSGDSP
ncbi:MAG TPA: hypothetical protein VFJ15_02880 [Oleiagrimonas sp.]|nr:hypothetical protein [Oleiagrimonas sp.]